MKQLRLWFSAGLVTVLAAAAAPQARAHPHIWIDSQVRFDLKAGKIVSVTLVWRFDPMFGGLLMRDFDKDKDKKFSKEETDDLRKRAFKALERTSYFTQTRVDGKLQKTPGVSHFSARIDDGAVVYTFTLRLAEPIDPRKQEASFRFLDPSYYVAVRLAGDDAIKFQGKWAKGCRYKIEKDTENPIYGGLVVPDVVRIKCLAS